MGEGGGNGHKMRGEGEGFGVRPVDTFPAIHLMGRQVG